MNDNIELPRLKTDTPSNPLPEKKEVEEQPLENVSTNNSTLNEAPTVLEPVLEVLPEPSTVIDVPPVVEAPVTNDDVLIQPEEPSLTPQVENNDDVLIEPPTDLDAQDSAEAPVELTSLEEENTFEEFVPETGVNDETLIEPPKEEQVAEPIIEPTIESNWAEKPIKQNTRDPIIIFFTLLIIAAIIAAAVYFFMNQGNNNVSPSSPNQENDVSPNNPNQENDGLNIYGLYSGEVGLICPDKSVTLLLNSDSTFTFNDLAYNDGSCEEFEFYGTFSRDGYSIKMIILGEEMKAEISNVGNHFEIRIPKEDEYMILSRGNNAN